MKNTSTETIEGIELFLLPGFISPWDLFRSVNCRFERAGLLVWDENREQYAHTLAGTQTIEAIRAKHGITWDPEIDGGGRWVLDGREFHCGDSFEMLRGNGTWLPVRFEVAWHTKDAERYEAGGRAPRVYVDLAGGCWIVGTPEALNLAICRWPKAKR